MGGVQCFSLIKKKKFLLFRPPMELTFLQALCANSNDGTKISNEYPIEDSKTMKTVHLSNKIRYVGQPLTAFTLSLKK